MVSDRPFKLYSSREEWDRPMMALDRPLHQSVVSWERFYGKQLEVVVGHQQSFPINMKPHPYEGKGKFYEFLHTTYRKFYSSFIFLNCTMTS
jgi:hypothetical protein